MTTTQELLESSFELNLSNYGPEDVERLNDWAIKAHNALEALQAEHTDEVMRGLMLEKAHAMGLAERDAALARLAEIEKQEPAYLLTPDGKCYAYGSAQPLSAGHADATLLKLYAAAGASPQQSPLLQFCTCEDCKPMECEGCRINRERRELLLAPSEAAREYMTGYSDGREWAGATNQAQPSQAVEDQDAMFTGQHRFLEWNRTQEKPPIPGSTEYFVFENAVRIYLAAINAKEQPNG